MWLRLGGNEDRRSSKQGRTHEDCGHDRHSSSRVMTALQGTRVVTDHPRPRPGTGPTTEVSVGSYLRLEGGSLVELQLGPNRSRDLRTSSRTAVTRVCTKDFLVGVCSVSVFFSGNPCQHLYPSMDTGPTPQWDPVPRHPPGGYVNVSPPGTRGKQDPVTGW